MRGIESDENIAGGVAERTGSEALAGILRQGSGPGTRQPRAAAGCVIAALTLASGLVFAHEAAVPIAAKKLVLRVGAKAAKRKLVFMGEPPLAPAADPGETGAALLVMGTGAGAGRTALIDLDRSRWKATGAKDGPVYKYRDPSGSAGGVKTILVKRGKLVVKAGGSNFPWTADGAPGDAVWVLFRLEEEWMCAHTPITGGGKASLYTGKGAHAPEACPAAACGNGEREPGESCDDGNVNERDGCTSGCEVGPCDAEQFDSTFAAIQKQIFDSPTYGCTAGPCHDGVDPQGGLDLTAASSYANLVGAATGVGSLKRVEPGEPSLSLLYEKLAARTIGGRAGIGTPMPSGGAPALTADHLAAVSKWIRGGAPADRVVDGTAALLATCLPPPQPLIVDPPDPPGGGVGIQLRQPAYELPPASDNEICMSTYYDFTKTNLVPEWAQFDCPEFAATNNPSGKCFVFHKQKLVQDAQSHHSIIHIYAGVHDQTHPGWGPWTHKFADGASPHGAACDPTAVDPGTGYNAGCSGAVQETIACLGYGPPDFSNFGNPGAIANGGNAPSFAGSQEPYFEQTFADGVYAMLPMQGIVVWNSHSFNFTTYDSTMSQYLNLEFSRPEDQRYPLQGIFDASSIFVQDVPPFETREYCRTYTLPEGARLFELSSHMHQWGVLFRIWGPPQTPCVPACPGGFSASVGCERDATIPICSGPGDPADLMYTTTDYSDPLQLYFDPPRPHDTGDDAARTYLYCAVYDNGATPASPPVKLRSRSPVPPLGLPVGGPCGADLVACLDGPNQGMRCGGDDAQCPGSVCDACPLRGGMTTGDEMFILLGSFYVPR